MSRNPERGGLNSFWVVVPVLLEMENVHSVVSWEGLVSKSITFSRSDFETLSLKVIRDRNIVQEDESDNKQNWCNNQH
jgi:hypothetical protein